MLAFRWDNDQEIHFKWVVVALIHHDLMRIPTGEEDEIPDILHVNQDTDYLLRGKYELKI
tara:strand:+ start:12291 stop:12470 length:180 start_codon:yes stop_codon:yes gene_type:complete